MLPSSIASWPLHRQKGFFVVIQLDIVTLDKTGQVNIIPSPTPANRLHSVQTSLGTIDLYIPGPSSNYNWSMIGAYTDGIDPTRNQMIFILYEGDSRDTSTINETAKLIKGAWVKARNIRVDLRSSQFMSSTLLRAQHTMHIPHSNLFCYAGTPSIDIIGRVGRGHALFRKNPSGEWSLYDSTEGSSVSQEPREICLLTATATSQLRQIFHGQGQFLAQIINHLNSQSPSQSLLHLFQRNGIDGAFYFITPHILP
jgi:hypothetical protein